MKFSTFLLASLTLVLDSGFVRGQFRGTTMARQRNDSRTLQMTGGMNMGGMGGMGGMNMNMWTCATYDDDVTECERKEKYCVYDTGNKMCIPRPCNYYNDAKKGCKKNRNRCVWDKNSRVCSARVQ
mmetsp:Transcript_19610/g.19940  ORF Transcript_19610/g.19940 Transcript_19610/m.19940 type:complete len:126 (+) Transcript_19610:175-552(+)